MASTYTSLYCDEGVLVLMEGRSTLSYVYRTGIYVLVLLGTDVRHVTPVIDTIYTVWSVRRVENAWGLCRMEDVGQVVDVSLIGRVINDIHCLSERDSDPKEDPQGRDGAHG